MSPVIVLDDRADRAEFVRDLLNTHVPAELGRIDCITPSELNSPFALVHWSLLNRRYTDLAQLRGKVQILFYCLCAEMRHRERILLLPDEMDKVLKRIERDAGK